MIPAVLLGLGYAVAVPALVRLRRAFRTGRPGWVVAEEAGTAAIVAGWLATGDPDRRAAAAVNAAWGLGLAAAWLAAARRRLRA